MTRYAALLRGINVGGNKKVPMKDLVALTQMLGHKDVSTYVQSGNLFFSSDKDASIIVDALEKGIEKKFGFSVDVVLRDHAQLVKVAAAHPFHDGKMENKHLHVMYLSHTPAKSDAAKLDPNRSPGDRFVLKGAEVFMHMGAGAAGTKLTVDYFMKLLGTKATARNWNTVLKLAELTTEK